MRCGGSFKRGGIQPAKAGGVEGRFSSGGFMINQQERKAIHKRNRTALPDRPEENNLPTLERERAFPANGNKLTFPP